ncbi:glycoside hydrolase family 113 [Pseudotenacibaculum haliotis]|uniref:Glycoside hydrolase n=1 Tax=Pseudotenacibaculum haliotis TaxID=1862138 RepID=A0ABW5LRY0_9FLAO
MLFKREITAFFKVYLSTWVITFLLFLLNLLNPRISFESLMESYVQIISSGRGQLFLHSIFLIFYILFLIIRYFVRVYKKKGKRVFIRYFTFRLILPVLVVYIGFRSLIYVNNNEGFQYSWNHTIENQTDSIQDLYQIDGKHRGMTVYDLGRNNRTDLSELIRNNIEWVVILPYFYQEDEQTKTVSTPKEIGIWSHRDSMFIKSIEELHKKKIRVHLKPHLWMSSGWRANINFENSQDWDTWFASYQKTILHYAMMAEKTKSEMFCIGTELRSSVKQQPEKWMQLIKKIKTIYSGKLTYAANWDGEFHDVGFWDELDYIGIQGYFPLTENTNPNLEQIKQGWKKHIPELEVLSNKHHKKILFTEIGYRPDKAATKTPWAWGSFFGPLFKKKSDKTQYLAYKALFEELWETSWFAGTYVWQWDNSDFEIKEKPAQNAIANGYSKKEAD